MRKSYYNVTKAHIVDILTCHLMDEERRNARYDPNYSASESNITYTSDDYKAAARALIDQARYDSKMSGFKAAVHWIEGGCALCYYWDIREMYENAGLDPHRFHDNAIWEIYLHKAAWALYHISRNGLEE